MTIRAQVLGLGASLSGIAIAILAIGFVVKSCDDPSPLKLPPAIVKTIDSLDTTKPAFDAEQDSLRKAVAGAAERAMRYKLAAEAFQGRTRAAEALADSLARVAQATNAPDSAWRKAYDARTVEAVGLRRQVALTDSAYRSEHAALMKLSIAYGADTLRRISVEKLNAGLRQTIEELERPCKFLKYVSCPSRTTTGVVSSLFTLGVTKLAAK